MLLGFAFAVMPRLTLVVFLEVFSPATEAGEVSLHEAPLFVCCLVLRAGLRGGDVETRRVNRYARGMELVFRGHGFTADAAHGNLLSSSS